MNRISAGRWGNTVKQKINIICLIRADKNLFNNKFGGNLRKYMYGKYFGDLVILLYVAFTYHISEQHHDDTFKSLQT